ncbi:MAG TPA: ATP-binding protein, partial [Sphingomonas sp.]|nr:ATP-binding protein [Sphingomonas sp.]
ELRTPLNAILGYAQILQAGTLSERDAAAVGTIHRSGGHLLTLITDILDLSKIEAGHMDLEATPTDLRMTVQTVGEMICMRAEDKNLRFAWTVAPDVPQLVIADGKRLRQVLINLLGNAVKFTEVGDVRLEVGLISSDGGDARLRFDVRDTGAGIPPDKLQLVFEAFEQAGEAGDRANGTGLGLSISRHIIEAMGSRIEVESTIGVGSRFWFDLTVPLAGSRALTCGPAAETSGESHPRAIFAGTVPPPAEMDALLALARAGNMSALRAEGARLSAGQEQYRPFGEQLLSLARSYQSGAILKLIEDNREQRSDSKRVDA